MDQLSTSDLIIFALATFTGSVVAGLSGFAFGLIAASVWLYILTPAQTASLIALFAILMQGIAVWRLRRDVKLDRVAPFVIGGALGVPVGVALLRWISPEYLRSGVGFVLIIFSLYSFARPKLASVSIDGRADDWAVGLLSGLLGGATGLAGILTILWCGVRGWTKNEQRTVFQPTTAVIFIMILIWLGGTGVLDGRTLRLFAIGLPVLLAGHWLGLKLYDRFDEARFRLVVLVLLLVSGVVLVSRGVLLNS
jgi:uncharacterized membrane protein YfcA